MASFLADSFSITVLTNKSKSDYTNFDSKKEYLIKRFLKPLSNKKNKILRLFHGLKFSTSIFFYLLFNRRESLLFFVSNPPFLALAGYFLNLFRGQRYIYLIHDIYPDLAINFSYIKDRSIVATLWRFFNNKIFKRSKYNVMLGEESADYLSKRYPSLNKDDKLKIITNWASKEILFPLKNRDEIKKKYSVEGKFTILYSGNFGITSILEKVLELASMFKNREDILFLLVGDGQKKSKLLNIKNEKDLSNVIFLDFVDKVDLNELYNIADISLITLDKRATNLSVPSKFYNIIAVGTPIIAIMERDTDIAKIIDKCEIEERIIGHVFGEDEIDKVYDKILYLSSNIDILNIIRENSYQLFLENYSSSTIFKLYKKLFLISGEYMVDFHTHTTCSDGTLKPTELIKKAKIDGLKVIAITDHDNIAAIELAKESSKNDNITLIPGIEISSKFNELEIHIVGLFIDITNEELLEFIKKISSYRLERNVEMIKRYEEYFSKKVNMEELLGEKKLENIGKLDFARYMAKSGDIKSEYAAFRFYFSKDCPLFIEKECVSPSEAIGKIHKANGFAILAHPNQVEVKDKSELLEIIKVLKEGGLDGIEVYYTNHKKKDVKYYKKIARDFGLVISGGSDFHYEVKGNGPKLGHYGKNKKIPSEILDDFYKL